MNLLLSVSSSVTVNQMKHMLCLKGQLTFGFPHCSHLMYLAVERKRRGTLRLCVFEIRTDHSVLLCVTLTFLIRTEVLVGVARSLLLFVFGEGVSRSIRVLQRSLLTHRLLHF